MNALRELRLNAGLSQRDLAALLDVPLNTFRMWDSGLRRPAEHWVVRARAAVHKETRQRQLLPLSELANELGVHIRTLQAAVRMGRLEAQFSVRSVFGRPIRLVSRAAGQRFLVTHYRCVGRRPFCVPPLPVVPNDYHERLRKLRARMHWTQTALARRIGAAGKAVVYQWESRQRTPSPVLWQRVLQLEGSPRSRRSANRSDPQGHFTARECDLPAMHGGAGMKAAAKPTPGQETSHDDVNPEITRPDVALNA